jgi:hypothetical protein
MPVTFTHEFQHMINFVEHVLVRGGDSEDGWLDEGLSKYAEEFAGRSFGDNAHFSQFAIGDVFDAYQYLNDPDNAPGAYVRVTRPPGGAAFTLRLSNGSGSVVSAAVAPQLIILRIR